MDLDNLHMGIVAYKKVSSSVLDKYVTKQELQQELEDVVYVATPNNGTDNDTEVEAEEK